MSDDCMRLKIGDHVRVTKPDDDDSVAGVVEGDESIVTRVGTIIMLKALPHWNREKDIGNWTDDGRAFFNHQVKKISLRPAEPERRAAIPVHDMTGDPRFHAVLKEMGDLHDERQRGYGTPTDPFANVRASEAWGIPAWQGAIIRACDKIKRLQTYATTGQLSGERVEDAFLDLANYAAIGLVLFREGKGQREFSWLSQSH